MTHKDGVDYLLALHLAPGFGPASIHELLQSFDASNIDQVFATSFNQGALNTQQRESLRHPDWAAVEQAREWASQPKQHLLTLFDPGYPEMLRQLPDPPPVLYCSGNIEVLQEPQLAIVGSRKCTRLGEQLAFEMATSLGRSGLSICSGMALGIDTEAHLGALQAKAPTLAVLGTGIDRVYPASNKQLAYQIYDEGLLITEFALGTTPFRGNFPRRNRLISGISVGTLVVEADLKSGSLITAQFALEQGREVFAIPGSIKNPLAKGCHRLIRQGATLVETAADILESLHDILSLRLELESNNPISADAPKTLSAEYQNLLQQMDYEPISVDELAQLASLTVAEVSSMLLILELEGLVLPAAGGQYQRTTPRRA